MADIPIHYKYRRFEAEYAQLNTPVKARLDSFFRQVRFDPEDESILQVCGQKNGKLAYPLGFGWIVYWSTEKEKAYLTTLRPAKVIAVEIWGLAHFDEFQGIQVFQVH